MFFWRVTKYNPMDRDANGRYLEDTWTSYSDINKTYNNQILTIDEYIKTENAYVDAILQIFDCLKLSSLRINALEKNGIKPADLASNAHLITLYESIHAGSLITKQDIDALVRLVLRENIWCKLESNEMLVHFGYDFYMYIGSIKPCNAAIKNIETTGLFVESIEASPY